MAVAVVVVAVVVVGAVVAVAIAEVAVPKFECYGRNHKAWVQAAVVLCLRD